MEYYYDFLYKKCAVTHKALSYWLQTPEFTTQINSLIDADTIIDDEIVIKIMGDIFIDKLLQNERGSKTNFNFLYAVRAIKQISKKLYNDTFSWRKDQPKETQTLLKDYFSEEIIDVIPSSKVYKVLRSDILVNTFRFCKVRNDGMAYDTAKKMLFMMIRNGYKQSEDEEKSSEYFRVRTVVEDYALALEGDKKAWQKEYSGIPNDEEIYVVRKVSRNGVYEEVCATLDELLSQKKSDADLPDAPDDL